MHMSARAQGEREDRDAAVVQACRFCSAHRRCSQSLQPLRSLQHGLRPEAGTAKGASRGQSGGGYVCEGWDARAASLPGRSSAEDRGALRGPWGSVAPSHHRTRDLEPRICAAAPGVPWYWYEGCYRALRVPYPGWFSRVRTRVFLNVPLSLQHPSPWSLPASPGWLFSGLRCCSRASRMPIFAGITTDLEEQRQR